MKLHYVPRNSALHHWECRCKLFAILIVSVSLIRMKTPWLALFSLLLAAAFAAARLPLRPLLRDFRHWLWLLLIVFGAHALFRQEALSAAQPAPAVISQAAILSAAVVCWRLALIILYGILFTSVTRPREMQDALASLLGLVPYLPARRVATMLSLTIRFFPLLLDQSEEIRTAMKSRCGSHWMKSFRGARHFTLALFRQSLLRCDEIACALAARGYREDLPIRLTRPRLPHLAALAAVMLMAIVSVYGPPAWPA